MRIGELLDAKLLERHIADRVISKREHHRLPLDIYNYTARAQFENIWDEVTTLCRGLIISRDTGEIVARGFRKFFNINTSFWPESEFDNLPQELPEITTKLDGSLGILWRFAGERGVATRGSFGSEQAIWASRWYEANLSSAAWPEGWSPLFEIVFPENRIVVKYEWEGMALLALVNNETGEEMPYHQMREIGKANRCRIVEMHDINLDQCLGTDNPNEEGYVATWRRPGQSPLKVKIKFAEYCRLHRLVTGISPKEIWRMMAAGEDFAPLTENVPDNYLEWVNGWRSKLNKEYARFERMALTAWDNCPHPKNGKDKESRKAIAQYFTSEEWREVSGVLFKMLDGQPYADALWKMARPVTADLGVFKPNDE